MKLTAAILAIVGVLLAAFAAWGLFTKAGHRRYDEMDAYYPFFAGLAGGAALVAAALLWIIAVWRSK